IEYIYAAVTPCMLTIRIRHTRSKRDRSSDVSSSDLDAGAARLGATVALDGLDAGPDTGRLVVLRVDDGHVAHVDRRLADDQATGLTAEAGLGVAGDPLDTLHPDALGLGVHRDDLAPEALVPTGQDLDEVTLLDLQLSHGSDHLRCERDDLHELPVAKLTTDGTEDAGPAGLAVGPEDDGGVLVELDVRAVDTAALLGRADDDRLDDVALLDVAAGDGVLDGGDDRVADTGVPAAGAAEHTDAQDLLGTGVVGDAQSRLLLDHFSLLSSCWFSPGASLAELDFRTVAPMLGRADRRGNS